MKVPFQDLQAHHAPMREEILLAINEVIDSGDFSGGGFVEKFENDFGGYCGARHAIGVGSGTDALWLTLTALGVGPGDEVITVPMTFIATAESISMTGAKPVFIDVDEKTYTMNPSALEAAINSRTKAIVPVHLFGQPAEMDEILGIAREYGIPVIEDASQAHGAEYKGRKAGTLADAGCFSFYPGKNLGAMGEGGAVVTNHEPLAEKLRTRRNHGQSGKNNHTVVGWNSRMDGIQAAVLSVKLRYLDSGNKKRRSHAVTYNKGFELCEEIAIPVESEDSVHVYHVYAIRIRERVRMIEDLANQGIGCGIHYPVPVHLQKAYTGLGHKKGDFPVSERCADQFVSLPVFPELSVRQIDSVIRTVMQCSRSLSIV